MARKRDSDPDPKNKSPIEGVHTQTYLGMMAKEIKADMIAKTKRKRRQPYKRTPQLEQAIWTRIACGESLKDICRDEKMPAQSTVYQWMAEDPVFEGKIDQAHLYQARYRHDEIKDILDNINQGDLSIEERKLKFKGYVWMAEKNNRQRYGQSVQVDHKVEGPPIILPDLFGGGILAGQLIESPSLPYDKPSDDESSADTPDA